VRRSGWQELVLWAADEHDADAFYLVEVYRDRPAMEENGRAPWFFEYLGVVGPLLDGQPEVMTATPTWAKGIAL
jgi:quinol monooxygenase YgiN